MFKITVLTCNVDLLIMFFYIIIFISNSKCHLYSAGSIENVQKSFTDFGGFTARLRRTVLNKYVLRAMF